MKKPAGKLGKHASPPADSVGTERLGQTVAGGPALPVGEVKWTPSSELAALMNRARADGLYFFCPYQSLWFSPGELEAAWAEERFRWGAINWELRDPAEKLQELTTKAEQAEQARQRFAAKLAKARGGEQDAG